MIGGFTMKHKLKDPGSAITHLIGMILAAIVSIPLIIKSFLSGDYVRIISLIIFTISMIGLYGASTAYHSFNNSPMINKKLNKLDHAMIFVLIAGSYTPICTIVLGGTLRYGLLSVIWIIAILGIVFKMFWVTCPKWVSSVMYIAMGWLCINPPVSDISGNFLFSRTGVRSGKQEWAFPGIPCESVSVH